MQTGTATIETDANPFPIGYVGGEAFRDGEYSIRKFILCYAYARNGNAHNPTPEVRWTVFRGEARCGSETTLRAAKEFVREMKAEVTQ